MWISRAKILSHTHQNFQEKVPVGCIFKCPPQVFLMFSPQKRRDQPSTLSAGHLYLPSVPFRPQAGPPTPPQLRQVSGPPERRNVANANKTGRRVCCLQTWALSKRGFWLCATGGLLGSKARRNLLESYLISLMIKEIKRRTTPSYQRPPVNGQVQNPMAGWMRVWGTGGTLNTSWASVGCCPTVL